VTTRVSFPDARWPRSSTGGAGTVLAPASTSARSLELCQGSGARWLGLDYLSADRVEIRYTMPLAEIIFDFFASSSATRATPR